MVTLCTDPALLDAMTHLAWAVYLLAISATVLFTLLAVDTLRDLLRRRR